MLSYFWNHDHNRGVLGNDPSRAEILDWLSRRLQERGSLLPAEDLEEIEAFNFFEHELDNELGYDEGDPDNEFDETVERAMAAAIRCVRGEDDEGWAIPDSDHSFWDEAQAFHIARQRWVYEGNGPPYDYAGIEIVVPIDVAETYTTGSMEQGFPRLMLRRTLGSDRVTDFGIDLWIVDEHNALPPWIHKVLDRMIEEHEGDIEQLVQRIDEDLVSTIEEDSFLGYARVFSDKRLSSRKVRAVAKALRDAIVAVMKLWVDDVVVSCDRMAEAIPVLVDWRCGNRQERLHELSLATGLRRAIDDHLEFLIADQRAELAGEQPTNDEQAGAEERVAATFKDDARIVEILGVVALAREGRRMHHCIGKAQFGHPEMLRSGAVRVFSYRNPEDKPRATWEAVSESLETSDLQGPYNGEIPDEDAIVRMTWFIWKLRQDSKIPDGVRGVMGLKERTRLDISTSRDRLGVPELLSRIKTTEHDLVSSDVTGRGAL
jgi:hypothetical protein